MRKKHSVDMCVHLRHAAFSLSPSLSLSLARAHSLSLSLSLALLPPPPPPSPLSLFLSKQCVEICVGLVRVGQVLLAMLYQLTQIRGCHLHKCTDTQTIERARARQAE